MTIYFEDLEEGVVYFGDECAADREEMLEYARKNDPWPFHLDEEAAKATPFGGLVASGGYTFTLWYRSAIPILKPIAHYGALPDWRFSFLHPVRPGDRLRAKVTIMSKRPSRRPERNWGYVAVEWEILNQEKQVVLKVNLEWIIRKRQLKTRRE
jgi:acyl dehydratase